MICENGAKIMGKKKSKIDIKYSDEIKKNIVDFYHLHKEECEKKYSDAVDKKKLNFYKELTDLNEINYLFLKTTIVILTANTFEKNILHLNVNREKKQKIIHCIIKLYNNLHTPLNINIYFFNIENYHVVHMEANQTGSYSMGGSADLIRFIMKNKYCYPSLIISYGICFGNDYHKQMLGDTIIANKLYPYFMSAKVKDKCILVKDSNIFNIDSQLNAKIEYLRGKKILSETNRIFYGNMVTGEAVISNEIMKKIFIKAATNQPVLGGEMEGYGLFKECQGFDCTIPCLLVKSICDWGAYKNIDEEITGINNLKDKLQAYASEQAYKTLSILVSKDANIVEDTIYEQVKRIIIGLSINDGEVLLETMLEQIINERIKITKEIENTNFLCKKILDILIKEGMIERIDGDVYRLKKGARDVS